VVGRGDAGLLTLDYWRARGNPSGYKDWVAVCRNRIRWFEARGIDPFGPNDHQWKNPKEYPQEPRTEKVEQKVGNVVRLVERKMRV
jgi:hypothetical protein